MEHQVVIVGAGPVGLFLALILQRNGVDVAIVERQKALYPLPRAVAFDHESRRLMGSVGLSQLVEEVLETIVGKGGQDGTNFVWRDADLKLIVDLFWELPSRSGYPFAMGFSQPELEGLLEKAVLDRGIPLIRGFALQELQHNPDSVVAKFTAFKGKGCDETGEAMDIKASYIIGCDGANSKVRNLSAITCTDLNFQNDWLILDLIVKNGYVPPKVKKVGCAQICDPKRPTTCVFGGRGRKRFEFMRLPNEAKETIMAEEQAWAMLKDWGFNPDNCYIERKVLYTFHARWADEFYKGRVILAGDALHLMPPFIGQGLNSGFRDAAALGWRLPLLLKGLAKDEKLLASYQNERLDHVVKLTKHCIRLGEVICETDPEKALQIHKKLRDDPPANGYDPPLGRPGTFTVQPASGRLSLQRLVASKDDTKGALFDQVFGHGWILLSMQPEFEEKCLHQEARDFFIEKLGGKCISITAEQDITGEYASWFAEEMQIGHVVLIRPDFYVFGHSAVREASSLVMELGRELGAF